MSVEEEDVAGQPDNESTMSRRRFLKESSAAAYVVDVQRNWLDSDIHLTRGSGWLALCRKAREIFRLDCAAFHGNPTLWNECTSESIAFGLEGARFPGTNLCADLVCELWRGAISVHTSVRYHALNLTFRGFAGDWLCEKGLFSRLSQPFTLVNHSDFRLVVGRGDARLSADGTLQFYGETVPPTFLTQVFISLAKMSNWRQCVSDPALLQNREEPESF